MLVFFFFNDTATTEIYTLSLHDALPISSATEGPLLELKGIEKRFGAVQVLHGVDFHVARGEVMALVGDNGAGKSTLIKCIAGIYSIDEGEVLFDGERVNIHGPKEASRLGIEVVYQDLALADNLDVVQNMFLGREEVKKPLRLNEIDMERRASDTLRELSVTTIRSVRQTVAGLDRKSTRLNSSHANISYAVFCLK